MRGDGVTVFFRKDRSTSNGWGVRWNDTGKRRFKYFPTQQRADAYAEQKRIQLHNEGLRAFSLSDKDRYDAILALEVLRRYDITLLEAARIVEGQRERTRRSCTVKELVEVILREQERSGASDGHRKLTRLQLHKFALTFGDQIISEIGENAVADWLHNLPVSPGTKHSYLRSLKGLFKTAQRKKLAEENPAEFIKPPKPPEKPVEIYTPQVLRSLIEAAEGEMLVFILLGAFAGLRSSEIARLDWSHVCLIRRVIEVPAAKSKTKRRRPVPIQPNLYAFLQPLARPSGPIITPGAQKTLYRRLRKAFAKAGVTQKHNALRHSFCSYRLPVIKSADALALEMGNSPGMIFRHYREITTEADVQAYWEIHPPTPVEIIPFTPAPIHPTPEATRSEPGTAEVEQAVSCG